jgi:hypothetical protein
MEFTPLTIPAANQRPLGIEVKSGARHGRLFGNGGEPQRFRSGRNYTIATLWKFFAANGGLDASLIVPPLWRSVGVTLWQY